MSGILLNFAASTLSVAKMNVRHIFVVACFVASLSVVGAVPQRSSAVVDLAPYCFPANRAATPAVTFMPDGKSYVVRSDDGKRLIAKDIATDKELETLFDLGHTRETELPDFESFVLSPDASKILLCRDRQAVYRRSATAQYYVYERRSRLLKPLSLSHSRQRDPIFSPDSRMVAFVADGNIYAAKLDYGTEVAVTTDGAKGRIINGATDWTYEEEFGVTALMAWAPDNLTLCYVRFDESDVPSYPMMWYEGTCNPLESYALYPGVTTYKYPVAGEPNSKVSLQCYDVETRKTNTVTFPGGDPYYIPTIGYGPAATQLMVSTLNRDQNRYELFSVNPKSTVVRSVYTQTSYCYR